jgi:peptidoglycan L-alanyl-D-glutamate endopeptidase CwlK
MYKLGTNSNRLLSECHPNLGLIANYAMDLQIMDFAIICGHRNKEDQTQAYQLGNSRVLWPKSGHNKTPSHAFDFAPWIDGAIPWGDTHAFAMLGGIFLSAGSILRIPVRYGGDWNRNGSTQDQILMDWGHIELIRHD